MPHFMNQHEDKSPKGVFLTDAQFNKLVELLTPGYKLSKMYLELAMKAEAPSAPEPEKPQDPPSE